MMRENLDDFPEFALPKHFSMRWYQPGDENIWRQVQSVADKLNEITPELFSKQFGNDMSLISQRQIYLLDSQGRAIGTATAWFNDNFEGSRVGRIHWLAILPEHQGNGLGKPLMTGLCRRLKNLGHARTYLSTASMRIPAINLYLKFGFAPLIRNEAEAAIWSELQPRLKFKLPASA